jgi:hypothetical protein
MSNPADWTCLDAAYRRGGGLAADLCRAARPCSARRSDAHGLAINRVFDLDLQLSMVSFDAFLPLDGQSGMSSFNVGLIAAPNRGAPMLLPPRWPCTCSPTISRGS